MTQPTKQVNFTASYVCNTKFDSAMFRVIEIPDKFQNHPLLSQKLKQYEDNDYIYINMKKLSGVSLDVTRKLKIYLLFEDFTDKKGDYVLYYSAVLVKDKGELPDRQFNQEILDSDDEGEVEESD